MPFPLSLGFLKRPVHFIQLCQKQISATSDGKLLSPIIPAVYSAYGPPFTLARANNFPVVSFKQIISNLYPLLQFQVSLRSPPHSTTPMVIRRADIPFVGAYNAAVASALMEGSNSGVSFAIISRPYTVNPAAFHQVPDTSFMILKTPPLKTSIFIRTPSFQRRASANFLPR